MKKLIALVLITGIGSFISCEKEELTETKNNEIVEIETQPNYRAVWPSIKIKIDSGTRKQADKERPYTDKDLGTCHGRSFCFLSSEQGEILAGGVEMLSSEFHPGEGDYAFTLSKEEESFKFSVSPEDILPETSDRIFREHIFVMDADYTFPEWVQETLGTEETTLSKGIYSIDQDELGNIFFYFE